ncbi:MAG: hypothetical protein ACOC2D_00870 [Spirochaetota bacterium]
MNLRSAMVVLLGLVAAALGAQEPYSEGLLKNLRLENEAIEEIQEIQRESAAQIRLKRAELEVSKAELARLLAEDDPSLRAIERNLRDTAGIEAEIRMLEIERELAIREVVGTDRWTRIARALVARRAAEAREDVARSETARQLRERLATLERAIDRRQEEVRRAIEDREELVEDRVIRRQLDLLREEYRELQELIRDRL